MKKRVLITYLLSVVVFLTGCMYKEQVKSTDRPSESDIEVVDKAVAAFSEDNGGLLPIVNKEMDMNKYVKYPIDFKRLVGRYLDDYPSNSYDAGGIFQYVIVDPETDPKIRLVSIRLAEELSMYNLQMNSYLGRKKYPPFGKQLSNTYWTIDTKKFGMKTKPTVTSPYSGEQLPVVMHFSGQMYVDYSIDVSAFIAEHQITNSENILDEMAKKSFIAPAWGIPLAVENGKIVVIQS
ncbi:MAG: hypothetical protein ACRCWQ_04390 [Bacilli bacterium]